MGRAALQAEAINSLANAIKDSSSKDDAIVVQANEGTDRIVNSLEKIGEKLDHKLTALSNKLDDALDTLDTFAP